MIRKLKPKNKTEELTKTGIAALCCMSLEVFLLRRFIFWEGYILHFVLLNKDLQQTDNQIQNCEFDLFYRHF